MYVMFSALFVMWSVVYLMFSALFVMWSVVYVDVLCHVCGDVIDVRCPYV